MMVRKHLWDKWHAQNHTANEHNGRIFPAAEPNTEPLPWPGYIRVDTEAATATYWAHTISACVSAGTGKGGKEFVL